MPACVDNYLKCNNDILKYNKEIIRNIIYSYLNDMNKYVYNSFEATRIEEIYKTIPSQLENSSRKFQYSKIKKGARSKDYESALNWLYSSNLIHKCTVLNSINIISLYYWKSKSDAEIDFIIYNDDGLIPIEVKSSENTKSKSLKVYIDRYNPKYAIRISSKNFGFENNIKSVPLYATFLIK